VNVCDHDRLVAAATMEHKIYQRQMVKLGLSHRVVDEQQVDRLFKRDELEQLYRFEDSDDESEPTAPTATTNPIVGTPPRSSPTLFSSAAGASRKADSDALGDAEVLEVFSPKRGANGQVVWQSPRAKAPQKIIRDTVLQDLLDKMAQPKPPRKERAGASAAASASLSLPQSRVPSGTGRAFRSEIFFQSTYADYDNALKLLLALGPGVAPDMAVINATLDLPLPTPADYPFINGYSEPSSILANVDAEAMTCTCGALLLTDLGLVAFLFVYPFVSVYSLRISFACTSPPPPAVEQQQALLNYEAAMQREQDAKMAMSLPVAAAGAAAAAAARQWNVNPMAAAMLGLNMPLQLMRTQLFVGPSLVLPYSGMYADTLYAAPSVEEPITFFMKVGMGGVPSRTPYFDGGPVYSTYRIPTIASAPPREQVMKLEYVRCIAEARPEQVLEFFRHVVPPHVLPVLKFAGLSGEGMLNLTPDQLQELGVPDEDISGILSSIDHLVSREVHTLLLDRSPISGKAQLYNIVTKVTCRVVGVSATYAFDRAHIAAFRCAPAMADLCTITSGQRHAIGVRVQGK